MKKSNKITRKELLEKTLRYAGAAALAGLAGGLIFKGLSAGKLCRDYSRCEACRDTSNCSLAKKDGLGTKWTVKEKKHG